MKYIKKYSDVLIRFKTESQAEEFVSWLSNSGEQEYFAQDEYVDDPELIAKGFKYDYETNVIIAE